MLRVKEVAKRLNCSIATVYSLLDRGKLEHHRCPGVRVSEAQLTKYLESTVVQSKRERGMISANRQPPRPRVSGEWF